MSKKMFVRLLAALSFLAAAVLYLLSVVVPDSFGWFNLAWAGVIFAGVTGLAVLLNALGTKNSVTLKKMNVLLSAGLLVIAAVCLVWALALPESWILPLILVIVALAFVLSILFTGGKKWDEGDNHKAGYKNYYQRKEEEEKNKQNKDEQ